MQKNLNTNKSIVLIIFLLLVAVWLTGCNSSLTSSPTSDSTSQIPVETSPATVSGLPEPQVFTTRIPPVGAAARAYLDAWKAQDYESMYGFLSSTSQQAVPFEDFKNKYESVAIETTMRDLDYEILTDQKPDENTAQVNYRIDITSNLLGNLVRETAMTLNLENGQWRVLFDDVMILPELAGDNAIRMDLDPETRASIFDRNGNLLAGMTEATSIGLIPDFIDPENSDGLFGLLSRASGLTSSEIASRVENASPGEYLALGQVDTNQSTNILKALSQWGAVQLTNYVSRYYPGNGIAPHLVGYVQAISPDELTALRRQGYRLDEKIGRKGIEAWGEDTLVGKHGGVLYQLDSTGVPVSQLGSTPSETGQAIYSTIDSEFQKGVQEALRGFRGAAVVLEKDTGRVLAMASSPGFDPNAFQAENYNYLFTLPGIVNDPNLPEFNRASQGLYPLGSVFKIITEAAALESGLYSPDYQYDCQYEFNEVTGLPLYDWTYTRFLEDGKTQPSGLLTLPQGLIRSCNPFFWHLGRGLYLAGKTTAISEMARAFGLGDTTGIEIVDELPGNVPDPQSEVDAVNLAIGQGDLQVTPLQVADFIAAIGNGGTLYRPQAIEKIVTTDGTVTYEFKPEVRGTLPLKPENLKIIQQALVDVVRSNNPRGTAYLVFNGFNIPVAGKTGSVTNSLEEPHSWFAGYTSAGREDKRDIAIAVVTENSGEGSEISTPIFRRIVELYFQGRPGKLYPWESAIGITETPTSIYTETPAPEEETSP